MLGYEPRQRTPTLSLVPARNQLGSSDRRIESSSGVEDKSVEVSIRVSEGQGTRVLSIIGNLEEIIVGGFVTTRAII